MMMMMMMACTVSHRYGYGLMDAKAMVELAERWSTVPQQQICYTEPVAVNQSVLTELFISVLRVNKSELHTFSDTCTNNVNH